MESEERGPFLDSLDLANKLISHILTVINQDPTIGAICTGDLVSDIRTIKDLIRKKLLPMFPDLTLVTVVQLELMLS
jgi:hypothetical protein